MPWGRMDDSFHDHPKVEELSLAAVGLWAKCWSKALGQVRAVAPERRGFVSDATARSFAGSNTKRLVAELTRAPVGKKHGMWEAVEGGWMIHDFAEYLPKQRDPAEASAAGRKGAEAKWGKDKANSHGSSHDNTQADSQPDSHSNSHPEAIANGMAKDGSRASRSAYPSRPERTKDQDLGGNVPETLRPPDATERPNPPPHDRRRCTEHQGVADPPPCTGCRNARERADREDQTAEDRERDRRQRDLEAARNACTRCDGTWLTDDNGQPTSKKCDHGVRRAS